jgi:hypothetical protein
MPIWHLKHIGVLFLFGNLVTEQSLSGLVASANQLNGTV